MKLPKSRRDKTTKKKKLLKKFFATIGPMSGDSLSLYFFSEMQGKVRPVFQGTKRGCFEAYKAFCAEYTKNKNLVFRTPRLFHLFRRRAKIWIQKGCA